MRPERGAEAGSGKRETGSGTERKPRSASPSPRPARDRVKSKCSPTMRDAPAAPAVLLPRSAHFPGLSRLRRHAPGRPSAGRRGFLKSVGWILCRRNLLPLNLIALLVDPLANERRVLRSPDTTPDALIARSLGEYRSPCRTLAVGTPQRGTNFRQACKNNTVLYLAAFTSLVKQPGRRKLGDFLENSRVGRQPKLSASCTARLSRLSVPL